MVLTDALAAERCHWFLELGFDFDQADALARARDIDGYLVEVHTVREALARGCDIRTAFEIYS
jgi:hypothetical protein